MAGYIALQWPNVVRWVYDTPDNQQALFLSQNQGNRAKESEFIQTPTIFRPAVGAIAEVHHIKDVGFAVNIPAVDRPARRPGRTLAGSSVLTSAWEAGALRPSGSSAPLQIEVPLIHSAGPRFELRCHFVAAPSSIGTRPVACRTIAADINTTARAKYSI